MKKVLSPVLILAMVLGLGLFMTGCGDSEPYADYDLAEYITLPDYDTFEVSAPEVQITDEDIDKKIKENLEAATKTEKVTEGTVAKGDTVTIKFEGSLEDGTKPEGMSSESSELVLGSGSMIPGFEEGIYGATIGKEISVDVTFPDPYTNNTDLSGKPATFKITVLSKNVKTVPELNEAFVKENSEYKTVEEYRAAIAKSLEQEAYDEALYEIKEKLYVQIVEKTEVEKYPQKELDLEYEALVTTHKQTAKSNNVAWADYLESELGMDEATFEEQALLYAQQIIKQEMVIYAIAEKEGLSVTEEEYDKQLDVLLATAGFEDEKAFKENTGMSLEECAEELKLERDLLLTKELDTIYERLVEKAEK